MFKLRTFVSWVLVMIAVVATAHAQADDLKEIAQLPSQGQSGVALERVNAHLGTYPNDVQALFLKGVILADLKKTDEAIKIFKEVIGKYPNLPEPYNNLAVLYADMGQYDKAQKALEAAIKTHPSYATAHENLGDVYAQLASEAYGKALKLDNSNASLQGKLSLIKELVPTASKAADTANKLPVVNAAKTSALTVAELPSAKSVPAVISHITPAHPPAVKAAQVGKTAETLTTEESPKLNNSNQEVALAIDQWANAWAAKNVNAYLASYANSFKVPAGVSRKQWENNRRERINRPAHISVKTDKVRIKQEGTNLARVVFDQTYRADGVAKFTPKTLIMRKINGKWLIEQELTDH
jgi:tetratricopeptide (TPR) repeat protein